MNKKIDAQDKPWLEYAPWNDGKIHAGSTGHLIVFTVFSMIVLMTAISLFT